LREALLDADGIRDVFEPAGPVQIRRMFGGHGIYREGRIVAIEADGAIWLKADAASRAAFEAAGSRPFTYAKGDGAKAVMSYWSLPEAAFDDPDELRRWTRLAEAAALRAAQAKTPRPKC